jgi:hypothetical protein
MSIFYHTDDPIVAPPVSVDAPKVNTLEGFEVGDLVGNPLYTVVDEHAFAASLVVLSPLLIWLAIRMTRRLARNGWGRAVRVQDAFRVAPLTRRVASVAILYSAVLHATLVFTHEFTGYTLLYGGGAVALAAASRWILTGRRPRLSVLVVVGSILTFVVLGAPADQLGLVTKLMEGFALILLALPVPNPTRRRRLAPAGAVALVVVTGLAAWIGAFATVGEDGGHHGGEYPNPGTLVAYIDRLEPTHEEQDYADDLHTATVAAVEKYRDPAVAEAAGYQVGVIRGSDHHAENPALGNDGRVLDPEYPESLIYAETDHGPVLIGVMFEAEGFKGMGPTTGGPLMLWHSHENVCFALTPPAFASLESPFGLCPVGSINIPQTGETLHAWVLPGVADEDKWGHVDEEWLATYLDEHGDSLALSAGGD